MIVITAATGIVRRALLGASAVTARTLARDPRTATVAARPSSHERIDRAPAPAASPRPPVDLHVDTPGRVVIRKADEFRVTPVVTLFEGRQDGIETSVYDTSFGPGDGPRLHRHPYAEVFLVQDGRARFHVDGDHYDVERGHFVVVAPETAHRYENPGPGTLRVISVHPNGVTIQTNLKAAA